MNIVYYTKELLDEGLITLEEVKQVFGPIIYENILAYENPNDLDILKAGDYVIINQDNFNEMYTVPNKIFKLNYKKKN